MSGLDDTEARCHVDPRHVINLYDYPEALHDPCGEVVCNTCGPCDCQDWARPAATAIRQLIHTDSGRINNWTGGAA